LFGNYASMMMFHQDGITLLMTAFLVIAGGISYVVVADIARSKNLVKLALDTKLVLIVTGALLLIGTIFYLVAEFSNPSTLGPLLLPQKLLLAFFSATVPRTAGFSALDISNLTQATLFITIVFMFIGGAAGSTAGGLKVNTVGVLGMTIWSLIRGRDNIEAFGRQVNKQTVYRAVMLLCFYLCFLIVVVLVLSSTENFPFMNIFFESVSACGLVGLSTGITPDLSIAGRIVIILTMFTGRLGALSLMAYLVRRKQPEDIDYPHESVRMG